MKKNFFFAILLLLAEGVLSQSPFIFNYQAVLRDASGQIIPSEHVSVEISLLKGSTEGSAVFSETHNTQTNEFGIINLQIGSVSSLENINWNEGPFFIQVSLGGQIMGVSQLLSVPFALHAATSADSFSADYNDLVNTPDLSNFIAIPEPQSGDLMVFSGNNWSRLPAGSEGQVLTVSAGMPQWVNLPGNEPDTTIVIDIDGNIYPVIIIGNQQWMGKNLRTSKYADGSAIPTNLDNSQWSATTQGAFAVQAHGTVNGIDSEEQMIEIYGKIYNWYAVDDSRGLCPVGWRVPNDQDWDMLTVYLNNNGYAGNEGNAIKTCRQIDSPLTGDCNTTVHPRWNAHATHFGTDNFGFSLLPAGFRRDDGPYFGIGGNTYMWSSVEYSAANGGYRAVRNYSGAISPGDFNKRSGFSVRCIKE
jgi:uncharacterized protein (TIGR02145 family)